MSHPTIFFLFQSSELMALAASLRDSILGSHHRKAIPQVKPSDYFPYQEENGKSSLLLVLVSK